MPFRQVAPKSNYKLITKYVHNANTVYQPSTIDMTTGNIGFSSPHGLSTGQILMLGFNQDINGTYCPNEWFSDINYLKVTAVVDSQTIRLGKASTSTDYTSYVTKSTVDMTKVHFESLYPNFITVNGFSTSKLGLRALIEGGQGDFYIYPHELAGGSWQAYTASIFSNGLALSSNAVHALFRNVIADVTWEIMGDNRCVVRTDVKQWTLSGSPPTFSDHSPGTGYGMSTRPFASNVITSIDLNGNSVGASALQYFLNGTVIELYDLS